MDKNTTTTTTSPTTGVTGLTNQKNSSDLKNVETIPLTTTSSPTISNTTTIITTTTTLVSPPSTTLSSSVTNQNLVSVTNRNGISRLTHSSVLGGLKYYIGGGRDDLDHHLNHNTIEDPTVHSKHFGDGSIMTSSRFSAIIMTPTTPTTPTTRTTTTKSEIYDDYEDSNDSDRHDDDDNDSGSSESQENNSKDLTQILSRTVRDVETTTRRSGRVALSRISTPKRKFMLPGVRCNKIQIIAISLSFKILLLFIMLQRIHRRERDY